jgi:hypothetical protein
MLLRKNAYVMRVVGIAEFDLMFLRRIQIASQKEIVLLLQGNFILLL